MAKRGTVDQATAAVRIRSGRTRVDVGDVAVGVFVGLWLFTLSLAFIGLMVLAVVGWRTR